MPTSMQRSGYRSANGARPVGSEHRGGDRHDVGPARPERHASPRRTRWSSRPTGRPGGQAGGRVERGRAVHLLGLVVLGRRVAVALAGDGVHDHRAAEAPGPPQRRLHRGDVVPVDRAEVLEAEVGEQLLRAQRVLHPGLERVHAGVERRPDDRGAAQGVLAGLEHPLVAGLQPQRRQPVGEPTDRRGVGAAVVVDDDDEVAVAVARRCCSAPPTPCPRSARRRR